MAVCYLLFFFSSRRRHTRWNCDWSSDVCSSDLYWTARHHGVAASPPPPLLRLHGERIVDALLLGEASKIGSTPPSSVITVYGPLAPPSVATIITASPFCKSANAAAGMRLIICCRSAMPPSPDLPVPSDPPDVEPLTGAVLRFGDCSALAGDPLPFAEVADEDATVEAPFKRAAICCATGGGSLRNCDSGVILTVMGFLAAKS